MGYGIDWDCVRLKYDKIRSGGMRWDGMEWDGMGWDSKARDGLSIVVILDRIG
jgi:hypothetical protein